MEKISPNSELILETTTRCSWHYICKKYKKAKSEPIVAFPLVEIFNETIIMDLLIGLMIQKPGFLI